MGSECVSSASRFVDSARPSVYASFTKTLLRDEWSIPGIESRWFNERSRRSYICVLNSLSMPSKKHRAYDEATGRLAKIAPTQYTIRKCHSCLTEYVTLVFILLDGFLLEGYFKCALYYFVSLSLEKVSNYFIIKINNYVEQISARMYILLKTYIISFDRPRISLRCIEILHFKGKYVC